MKQKLKWYAPLNRWLTEAEHRAHVAVEPELADVYASIVAEAIPVTPRDPEPVLSLPYWGFAPMHHGAQNSAYDAAYLASMQNCAQGNSLQALAGMGQSQQSPLASGLFGSLFR